jgi:hypothetical protein
MPTVKMELGEINEPLRVLGQFRLEAKRQGWSDEELRQFMNTAFSADSQHLVKLIQEHTENSNNGI